MEKLNQVLMKRTLILMVLVLAVTIFLSTFGCRVKDKDGSTQKTVKINNQEWMTENLNVSAFRNGDSIPEAKTDLDWEEAGKKGKPAWCYYANDPANGIKYGKLYNWYAVNDPRGLAPAGWHVPTDAEWTELINSLGGGELAGAKMKSTTGWVDNRTATNESGFSGLPGDKIGRASCRERV